MSSNQHNLPNPFEAAVGSDVRIAVIQAQWNSQFTDRLTAGCLETLQQHGVDAENIDVYKVPGAVELTFGASAVIETGAYDAVIVFGCVVRGDTPHFDYVCQSVTQGVTHLNAECDIPVIFGLLTVENEEQAAERTGGRHGHKGCEAADTALQMIAFADRLKDI